MENSRVETFSPLVSIIVPTYNSGQYLDECLLSIQNQDYGNIELIVVDKYSNDRTIEIALKYTDLVFKKGPERCSQRNYGFWQSKGDYVVFIDSDMILSQSVISEAVKKLSVKTQENYDGIYIPEISIGIGFWAACKALEKRCYIGDESIEAARFFRRDVFENVNGYDEKLISAEDWDISRRIVEKGYTLGHINALIKHNEGNLSLLKTMKKKYYYGQKIYSYIQKHNNTLRQFSPLRPAFFRNWRLLLQNPGYFFGLLFMKYCEFLAGGLGGIKSISRNIFRS